MKRHYITRIHSLLFQVSENSQLIAGPWHSASKVCTVNCLYVEKNFFLKLRKKNKSSVAFLRDKQSKLLYKALFPHPWVIVFPMTQPDPFLITWLWTARNQTLSYWLSCSLIFIWVSSPFFQFWGIKAVSCFWDVKAFIFLILGVINPPNFPF